MSNNSCVRGPKKNSLGLVSVLVIGLVGFGVLVLLAALTLTARQLPPRMSVAGQIISNAPQDSPGQQGPRAMQTVMVVTSAPTPTPWIVVVTATPSRTFQVGTPIKTATRTRTPTRTATTASKGAVVNPPRLFATATRTPTRIVRPVRYTPITLHEPKNRQFINNDSVVFEWIPAPLTAPGDHYRVIFKRVGAQAWEFTCSPEKPGKCAFSLRGSPRGVRYVWTVVVLDSEYYVVSAPSELREFVRPSPDDPDGPAPEPFNGGAQPDPNGCIPGPDNGYCGNGPP